MTETFIVLICAHVFADFLFQSNAMVAQKKQPQVMALHIGIVVAIAWILTGTFTVWAVVMLLVLGVSHWALDAWKIYIGGSGFRPFAIDQAGHIVFIALIAALYPQMHADGLWAHSHQWLPYEPNRFVQAHYLDILIVVAGAIVTVRTGGFAVGYVTESINFTDDSKGLVQGGAYIGFFERLLVFIFVLTGNPEGIGFLIAAKSILRFQTAHERATSEYIIIGTLASFSWALAASALTKLALDAV